MIKGPVAKALTIGAEAAGEDPRNGFAVVVPGKPVMGYEEGLKNGEEPAKEPSRFWQEVDSAVYQQSKLEPKVVELAHQINQLSAEYAALSQRVREGEPNT